MDDRQMEINTVLSIVKNLLADSYLLLGTRTEEPLIVKDCLTGKIYALKQDGDSND